MQDPFLALIQAFASLTYHVAVYTFAATFILWVIYVVIMRLKRKRDAGLLDTEDKLFGTLILPIGIFLDALYNPTFGTLIFLDLPREWLFTARLQRYRREKRDSWRGRLATWFCATLLNPYDPEHC